MLLIDFEKAYDMIEWDYIIQMLQSLGFPPGFCNMVRTLLCDANVVVELNGIRSSNLALTRSIRQGCPLALALFVLVVDAMFYLLKDSSTTSPIRGISLPNKEEIYNVQFVDDTTLLIKLEEENLAALMKNIDLFCLASGSKISMHKSNLIGWDDNPPGWLSKFSLNWLGPTQIIKYLGIPFSVLPNIKEMWEWVRNKIDKKLSKWNRNFLYLAGRFQIREFLWSDGKGTRKQHAVKWEWCTMNKLFGGMGLKDLKLQGIALASKWILKAMEGNEPWKVLIRNNIICSVPKKAKKWKDLPILDILMGQFEVAPAGSNIFKSLWKAREHVTVVLKLNSDKFDRWIKEGNTTIYIHELSHGFTWERDELGKAAFEQALMAFMRQLDCRQMHMEIIQEEADLICEHTSHPHKKDILDGQVEVWQDRNMGWVARLSPLGNNTSSDVETSIS
ncbi:uncharacterized protein LOC131876588 [Cryptomeria japonica]|uniref:uncharacterized protein LOC131876588 n=1 Tax=Cryptomeria japonica TaxID=3369 RepID=UPI0027DA662B|nr:uncharacterized protein LOC131876588 [Cryptomeria japonica]